MARKTPSVGGKASRKAPAPARRRGVASSNVIDISTRKSVDGNGRRDLSVIRTRYAQGTESFADIAKDIGMPMESIKRLSADRKRNGGKTWSELRAEFRAEREAAVRAAAIEASAGGVAEALRMQGDISLLISQATAQYMKRLLNGEIQPGEKQGEADVFHKIMSGSSMGTDNVRTIAGLTAGQASTGSDDDDLLGGVELFGLDDDELLPDAVDGAM